MNGPQRIVSLLSCATEMLYLLELNDRVVGVSHECDYPNDAVSKPRVTRSHIDSLATSGAIDEQVKSRLAEGLPLYEVDVEQLVSLAPELIVTQAQCDVCAVRYEDVVEAVSGDSRLSKTPIVALNPQSLDDVFPDIQRVADAAGVQERGKWIVEALRSRVGRITSSLADLAEVDRPRVACIEWTEPLMLAANWMPELVWLAGGNHSITRGGIHSGYSALSELLAYDPQVLVVIPCGFSLERSIAEAGELAMRPGWNEIDAVKNGRVFAVDANAYFNRPGPRLVDSVEILAHLIHPTRFELPESAISAVRQIG